MTQNIQFYLIHNFSNLFPPKWLIFGQVSKFFIFWEEGGTSAKLSQICNFLNHFQLENDPQWPILPPKWLRLAQSGQFWSILNFSQVFPQKAAQIDSKWPISPDSQLFQSFPTKAAHFWQNLNIFHLGGYIELWSCQICHKQGSCICHTLMGKDSSGGLLAVFWWSCGSILVVYGSLLVTTRRLPQTTRRLPQDHK